MHRSLTATFIATAVRAPRHLLAVALALVLAGLLAHSAAALTDQEVDSKVQQRGLQCKNDGGTSYNEYEFNTDGSVASHSTSCLGASGGDYSCTTNADGSSFCVVASIRQPRAPLERIQPPAGTVDGVLDASD
ncbi:MAG: hypothetical protein M3464_07070 [Chloroflexota bacterium]|nr:hypothetical protein [Chloroflexota bacterium]